MPLLQQQAGRNAEQLPQLGPTQSVRQPLEPLSNASSQQMLPEQDEEDQPLLSQLHEGHEPPQQLPQQLQPPEITLSCNQSLVLAEQDPQQHQQHGLADQPLPSDQALLSTQGQTKQMEVHQHEQQDSVVPTAARGALVPPSTEHGEEWSTRQLVVFSLRPSRLWAFLGLGIPGGLASSVQSAASEVTTAMAGVLGEAHACQVVLADMLTILQCMLVKRVAFMWKHTAARDTAFTGCIGWGSSMLHQWRWQLMRMLVADYFCMARSISSIFHHQCHC